MPSLFTDLCLQDLALTDSSPFLQIFFLSVSAWKSPFPWLPFRLSSAHDQAFAWHPRTLRVLFPNWSLVTVSNNQSPVTGALALQAGLLVSLDVAMVTADLLPFTFAQAVPSPLSTFLTFLPLRNSFGAFSMDTAQLCHS